MKKIHKFVTILILIGLVSCLDDARVAFKNISTKADNFQILRRIVFFNGITDTYLLSIEGFCSIRVDNVDNQLEVTCKVGDNDYKKHYLGLSDNVTYFVEQLDSVRVSVYHYLVVFKPQVILPDIDFKGSVSSDELPKSQE